MVGEFQPQYVTKTILNSKELNHMNDNGFYKEIKVPKGGFIGEAMIAVGKLLTHNEKLLYELNKAKKRRKEGRLQMKLTLIEMESLYCKRFLEDQIVDDLESGQMLSWGIMGLNVPEINLYLDEEYNNYQIESRPRDIDEFNDSDNDSDNEMDVGVTEYNNYILKLPNLRLATPILNKRREKHTSKTPRTPNLDA